MGLKGFTKSHVIYYYLTNSPVSRMSTFRTILSLALKLNLNIHQMDVTSAFLNSSLEDDVIIAEPPPGYEHLVPKVKSMLLLKSHYGLKQASRMCNLTLDDFLKTFCGMTPSQADSFLYTKYKEGSLDLIIDLCR